MNSDGKTKFTTNEKALNTFVNIITDVYLLKKFMVSQVTGLAACAQKPALKMLLIQSATSLSNQIFRMDMAMQLLNKSLLTNETLRLEGINYQQYLLNCLLSKSLENDTRLINHLLLMVGIEVNCFRLLTLLSRQLYPRMVHHLMKDNLCEAVKNEKMLLNIYNTYLETDLGTT